MPSSRFSRRNLVRAMGAMAGGSLLSQIVGCKPPAMSRPKEIPVQAGGSADYTLTIVVKPVELAPNRIVSTATYNGQFPGHYCASKKAKQSRSTLSLTRRTRPSNCTGIGSFCLPVSMARRKKARRSFPLTVAGVSRSSRSLPGIASTTRTSARGANLGAGQYTGMVGPVYNRTEEQHRQLRSRSFPDAERVRTHSQPRRRHGHELSISRNHGKGTERFRRERHEGLARQRHAPWIRGRVWFLHN
jgi:hypothetical protein